MGSTTRGRTTRQRTQDFFWLMLIVVNCLVNINVVEAQFSSSSALSPNLLNLAEGRHIWASATCGDGVEKEQYCILGETHVGQEDVAGKMDQGQRCDYCDLKDPRKSHLAQFAIENNHKYWQSPPLSRNAKYNAVNLTIDLRQDFHVAYVFIAMGISPRPRVWALERSVDHGRTYTPWQYFASDEDECKHYFGKDVEFTITRDDSVICQTNSSSLLPLQYGEIHVPILTGRPSAENLSSSEILQKWPHATNIRLRLMRTNTLPADVMSVDQQDPAVTRGYFYSIRHIEVGGRCVCNGHASRCSPAVDGRLRCRCEHNTKGDQCERCDGSHNQRAWQPAAIDAPNECEKCYCHKHAMSCMYNATVEELGLSMDTNGSMRGGGVCQGCLHHTSGINCELCKPGYFRQAGKALTDIDVCTKCPCDFTGDDAERFSGECEIHTGKCTCTERYREPNCDECADGYCGYPHCRPCNSFRNERCATGFFGYPECKPCNCNPAHSLSPDCEAGGCQCKQGFVGKNCDTCAMGHFGYPECWPCTCDPFGSINNECDPSTGRCFCRPGFTGQHCDRRADGSAS